MPSPQNLTITSSNEFIEFSTFDPMGDPERQKLLNAANAFAAELAAGSKPRSLTLIGPSGIGKTHLATELWQWAEKQIPYPRNAYGVPQFRDVLFSQCQSACHRFLDGNYDWPDQIRNAPFWVLDDLGAEKDPRETFRNVIEGIICHRVGTHWTVVTSNLSFDQLRNYDARLASRLIRNGGKIVASSAEDFSIVQIKGAK